MNVDTSIRGKLARITGDGGGRLWFDSADSMQKLGVLRPGEVVFCLFRFERYPQDTHYWIVGISGFGLGVMGYWKSQDSVELEEAGT